MIGYEPKYLYPLALSAQRMPLAFVLWVTHQSDIPGKADHPYTDKGGLPASNLSVVFVVFHA